MTTDYGPGVTAAMRAHAPDTRCHDIDEAHEMALLVEEHFAMLTAKHAPSPFPRLHLGDSRIVDVEQARTATLDEHAERWGDNELDHDRIPTTARYDQHAAERGLISPAGMTGPAYSVDHVGLPSPDAHAIANTDRWLVWSNQHGMWWRDSGVGYTSQIDEAGRYSRAEAAKHVADATLDGALTHRRTDPITGREYSAVDEVAVLAPESIPAVTA